MNIFALPKSDADILGATHCVEIKAEDLTQTTANTAQTLTMAVEAGEYFKVIGYTLVQAFADASDAAFNTTTLIIGDGGDTDRFLTSSELNVNGTEVIFKGGTGTELVYTTADTVDFTFGSMTAKSLADIDQGRILIYVKKADFRDFIY